jgi:hypothetical protein
MSMANRSGDSFTSRAVRASPQSPSATVRSTTNAAPPTSGATLYRATEISARHLDVDECFHDSPDHFGHRFVARLHTCGLYCPRNLVHMILEHRKQQSLLVWIILVQGSDGHAGPICHACGRQTVCSVAEQYLNSRLTNCAHCDRCPRLNRHFPWFKCSCDVSCHMRIKPRILHPMILDAQKGRRN